MMFAGLRQALVLSCSECDFWKNWTHGFRGCSILRHRTFQRHHNTALLIRLRLTVGRAIRIYFTLHYIIVPKIEMYPNILACCRSLSVAYRRYLQSLDFIVSRLFLLLNCFEQVTCCRDVRKTLKLITAMLRLF